MQSKIMSENTNKGKMGVLFFTCLDIILKAAQMVPPLQRLNGFSLMTWMGLPTCRIPDDYIDKNRYLNLPAFPRCRIPDDHKDVY